MSKTSKTLLVIAGLILVMSLSFIVMADEYIEPYSPEEDTDVEELATAIGGEVVNGAFEENVEIYEGETIISEEIASSEENVMASEEIAVSEEEVIVSETDFENIELESTESESNKVQIEEVHTSYRVLGEDAEWTEWTENGKAASTEGRIAGVEIVSSTDADVQILYSVYERVNGWSAWMSGAVELENSISALRMTLSGENSSDYDIYYSVCMADAGYSEWVCNTGVAGDFAEEDCEITGIRVSIVAAGSELNVDAENDLLPERTSEAASEVSTEAESSAEDGTLAETEAETEPSTEADAGTSIEQPIEGITEASTESELSTESIAETEPVFEENDEDILEGTFHITSDEDDADILLVEEEGAAYTSLTNSSAGSISALYAYPNTYKNIGKGISDLIGVAATQVGYYRAENSQTKYGIWYGYPTSAWCAMFVSWCADQAGIDAKTIKPYCRCATEATWFKSQNRWKNAAGYTPQEGDLIFFHYNGSTINHTGIVTGTIDGYVYCIEGNNSDSVNITRHKLTANYISGYGNPDYSETDAGLKYSVHLRSYGWMDYVLEGRQAGTTGESRRMEAIKISLSDKLAAEGGISYRVHVRTYGWMPWVSNGTTAGTTGEYRRMEAIEIMLTGALAEKYDVYYRVHVRHYGWLGWTKNGGMAGTSGMALRMEAIEIQLVEKGGSAPGSTSTPYLMK